ncbi:MAG: tetratricopeptide repeat protein [Deltaproteobacteria bacterium]|jgi:tetratricopeptide (TPR) repeat protein|nr:tetratricopeptide repeat protein [Deltaproteobacteria bacterium]
MSRIHLVLIVLPIVLGACSTIERTGTIAELRHRHVDINDAEPVDGLDKAMLSYQRFLQENPESALAPEAIRRLADLKIEKEYGTLTGLESAHTDAGTMTSLPAHVPDAVAVMAPVQMNESLPESNPKATTETGETDTAFEARASSAGQDLEQSSVSEMANQGPDDLQKAGPLEAIALYQELLEEYPLYDRNDQVLYQMSRAYEELGRIEEAMSVMDRLVREYPQSRYIDEVQFRRGEYFFMRRRYLDAEDAYQAIVGMGVQSTFYPFALYKLGWTFYKQELYEDALQKFVALLDYKVSIGYDFSQTEDEPERKRMEDTFRVISLSFSYLGGAEVVAEYFERFGGRSYEDLVYSNLGEYYFDKRRYSDANASYNAFVERNPFHQQAPHFQMRIIEICIAGGFPSLVIDSKKTFAGLYGLQADYWQHFNPEDHQDVLGYLKLNLTDLANHYHAQYQAPEFQDEKENNFDEALHWYREFLASFPDDDDSPDINYQLADLLLENRAFKQAALEYEQTAYHYPAHEKSSTAGYAAVFAFREHLATVAEEDQDPVKLEVVRSSLTFAETFPEHDKAAVVFGAAVDDLYDMELYQQAIDNARKLIAAFPSAETGVLQSAWIVVGHGSYELSLYPEAETAYQAVLSLLTTGDERRSGLVDNLAASIYQQGAEANDQKDYQTAADHFLRIGLVAPTSTIRPNAEYDAATALIQVQDWNAAAEVLSSFRMNFPGHDLQPEVTKKIAYVYREGGQLAEAAVEYERIERESDDAEIRRDALLTAAELYKQTGDDDRALRAYQKYVVLFPEPVELNLETRHEISLLLLAKTDMEGYFEELRTIVAVDAAAGKNRTQRTRYLASKSGLILAEEAYARFVAVQLVKPIETNLRTKQALMKAATQQFNQLLDYEVSEVTAAATYYLAEIYAHFSVALMESERPDNLTPLELEQYELAIEEQAYPFEEQAIVVHQSNHELIALGIYNDWVELSLTQLAKLLPARYARTEAETPTMASPDAYTYEREMLEPVAVTQVTEANTNADLSRSMADTNADTTTDNTLGQNADGLNAEHARDRQEGF